jgi:hypothetical protein
MYKHTHTQTQAQNVTVILQKKSYTERLLLALKHKHTLAHTPRYSSMFILHC